MALRLKTNERGGIELQPGHGGGKLARHNDDINTFRVSWEHLQLLFKQLKGAISSDNFNVNVM